MVETRRSVFVSTICGLVAIFSGCTFPVPGSGEYRVLAVDGIQETSEAGTGYRYEITAAAESVGMSPEETTFSDVTLIGLKDQERVCSKEVGTVRQNENRTVIVSCPTRPDTFEYQAAANPCAAATQFEKIEYYDDPQGEATWRITRISCTSNDE